MSELIHLGNAMHEPVPARYRDILPSWGWGLVAVALCVSAACGLWWVV